jgi:ubiquinone/menaquinone biosynthesis C-methylase UbiE
MSNAQNAAGQKPGDYFMNQELVEEMVRLNRQGRIFTEAMGGVLAEQQDLSAIHDILDLACGPGEWAMRVAREYPDKRVVGVDLSRRMIEYASVQAEANNINATFQVMDITQPMDFPDASFNLINTRLISGFMKKDGWAPLLAECLRLLRPGGILRITDSETVLTNSLVVDTCAGWGWQSFQQAGQAFSVKGQNYLGITIALKPLLLQAGYVAPGHRAHAIDFSTGAAAHESTLEDYIALMKLGAPFLIRLGVATQEQLTEMREQLQALIGKEGFCGYWIFLTIWAQKP